MERKVPGRWTRTADGRLVLEELTVDEGPSSAAGVSRGRATGSRHRGATGQRQHTPRGMGVPIRPTPSRKKGHPADGAKTRPGWEDAVGVRRAREEKRRKAGLR